MSDPITPDSPVSALRGVGGETHRRLDRLGVRTVLDLIELLPRRIEDRSQLRPITELTPNETLVIRGTISKIGSRVSQRGVFIVSAKITDTSGSITALWFNQRFLLGTLREGQEITLFGEKRLAKSLGNPFFVKKIIPRPEVAPIYPLTSGLTQAAIQKLLEQCRECVGTLPDILPDHVRTKLGLPERGVALWEAHFRPSTEALDRAITLLGAEEIFAICVTAVTAKQRRRKQPAAQITVSDSTRAAAISALPFSLTASQQYALDEVTYDLAAGYPMNRLLYGEVGSGKTAVGLVSAALIAGSGKRVLWLSPTTTLAAQQNTIATEYFGQLGFQVAFLTARHKGDIRNAEVVVGTHALLHTGDQLTNVGFVIIDEQQRFGVDQRNTLLKQFPNAHLLMLSATPIPRTLTHTIFGHLDVSYLREKPSHQQPITSKVFTEAARPKVEEYIRLRVENGQPGYVICPLIESEEEAPAQSFFELERKAVTAEAKRWQSLLPQSTIAVLHGRLKAEVKERIIEDFRNGGVEVLVATSVVEVGIDNPAATWILIEEADRFGLAQLHQLRGRVGRGSRSAVCFLHNSGTTEKATERLRALIEARDGLEIAEKDLGLRGPGNIAGQEQSGLPTVRYANLADTASISTIYKLAEEVGSSPLSAYPRLARLIKRFSTHGPAPT